MIKLAVPKDVEIVTGFALKTALGSLAFFVVACVAVALKAAMAYIERLVEMPVWFRVTVSIIEAVIWGADVLVYGSFLATEVWESLRGSFKRWRAPHD